VDKKLNVNITVTVRQCGTQTVRLEVFMIMNYHFLGCETVWFSR